MKNANRFRVRVKASKHSTDYLVNKVVKSKKSPRQIVEDYMKQYPNVHLISAYLVSEYKLSGYSTSTGLI